MINKEVKTRLFETGIKQYQVAYKLGIHENSLCRKLRYELSKEEKEKLLKIIEELKKERSK